MHVGHWTGLYNLRAVMAGKNVCVTIPFPSEKIANLAFDVLSVDQEIKRSEVKREISVDGVNLIIQFYGEDFKKLRVSLNSILKHVVLITKTIELFNS